LPDVLVSALRVSAPKWIQRTRRAGFDPRFYLATARDAVHSKSSAHKGKFRSFLLASLNYFLADERDRSQAQKRGGGRELLSLELNEADGRYTSDATGHDCSPEKLYERRWAITLLDCVLARLAREFADTGRGELFGKLQGFLVEGSSGKRYHAIAAETGLSEEVIKKTVQRMRRRYYELFRQEIAQTVATPGEVEEELRHLCDVLSD
jgi:RNA polymerase sigma-70 factor (ECF subfamily)